MLKIKFKVYFQKFKNINLLFNKKNKKLMNLNKTLDKILE